eukprot:gene18977-15656_t
MGGEKCCPLTCDQCPPGSAVSNASSTTAATTSISTAAAITAISTADAAWVAGGIVVGFILVAATITVVRRWQHQADRAQQQTQQQFTQGVQGMSIHGNDFVNPAFGADDAAAYSSHGVAVDGNDPAAYSSHGVAVDGNDPAAYSSHGITMTHTVDGTDPYFLTAMPTEGIGLGTTNGWLPQGASDA